MIDFQSDCWDSVRDRIDFPVLHCPSFIFCLPTVLTTGNVIDFSPVLLLNRTPYPTHQEEEKKFKKKEDEQEASSSSSRALSNNKFATMQVCTSHP